MRWLFRIAGILVLAVLAGAIGVLMLPDERILRIATDQIEARTGRAMTVSGDVSLSFWPSLGVRTGPVTLANAEWAGAEPMLSAKSLSIGVSAVDLLSGTIRVTGIAAQDPVLRLQKDASGRVNWDFGGHATAGEPGAPVSGDTEQAQPGARAFALDLLELRNGRLIFLNAGSDPVTLNKVDLDLRWPDPSGPAELLATLHQAGTPVRTKAEIDAPSDFLAGKASQLVAQVELPEGKLQFDGQANMSGELAGRVDATSADMAKSLSALGLPTPDMPAGWGPAMRVSADLTLTADRRLSLRDLRGDFGENRLNGVADLLLGEVPQVTARLSSGLLTFPAQTGVGGTGASAPAPGVSDDEWSRAPIDASALGAVNGSIRLAADGIRTPNLTTGPVRLLLEIDRSRAVLHLEDVAVFDGQVTGRLVANNRGGLSVGGRLAAVNIDILALQRDLLGLERIRGAAAADLEFLGAGPSVDAIMRSLSGKGALRMGKGVILGLDLDRLMRGDTASGGTTVFDSFDASFVMRDGDMLNDDLLLQLSNYRADGKGRIGLGARDIDYTFTPIALRARSGQGISLPIRIRGPWGAPRVWPDLEAAAKANADAELKELEDKAKAKLQQKLAEELDVRIEDGQDAEEILKDRLKDEAKNQLLKLLGRN